MLSSRKHNVKSFLRYGLSLIQNVWKAGMLQVGPGFSWILARFGVRDVKKTLRLDSERGQTIVEYALILALVVIAVIVTLGTVGDAALKLWQSALGAFPA
jgi:Flp pilus assembly pilin Flp